VKRAAVAALAAVIVAAVVAYASLQLAGRHAGHGQAGAEGGRGLFILVSFPNLAYDVKPLLCNGDEVRSIAPPGSDPHSYQLTLRDYELLRRADLVISTGHAPFEVKMSEKVPADKIIVIPDVIREHGGIILVNPDTGKENLHMPIYDPRNYEIFIGFLAEKLASLNPHCRSHYLAKAEDVIARVRQLENRAPHLNVTAVASVPAAQYAVEWMGIHIVKLLVKEHGLAPTPEDVKTVESLLAKGRVKVAVIVVDGKGEPLSPADRKLEALARRYGVPVLRVPAPFLPSSTLEKLEAVVEEAEKLAG
jgi:zinc/manganese transport system substrate-binding protein